jgi:hypothetical protein
VHSSLHRIRSEVGGGPFHFQLQVAAVDVGFAVHQRLESLLGDFVGRVFFLAFGSDLGISQPGAIEKFRVGRPWVARRLP